MLRYTFLLINIICIGCSSGDSLEIPSKYTYDHSEIRNENVYVKQSNGALVEIDKTKGSPNKIIKETKLLLEEIVTTSPAFAQVLEVQFEAMKLTTKVRFDPDIIETESAYTNEGSILNVAGDIKTLKLTNDFETLEVCNELVYFTYKVNGQPKFGQNIDKCKYDSALESATNYGKTLMTNDTIAIISLIQVLKKN